jgi:hypothetical protein
MKKKQARDLKKFVCWRECIARHPVMGLELLVKVHEAIYSEASPGKYFEERPLTEKDRVNIEKHIVHATANQAS